MSVGAWRSAAASAAVAAGCCLLGVAAASAQAPASHDRLARDGGRAEEPGEAMAAYRSVPEGGVYRFTFDYRGGVRVRLPAEGGGAARGDSAPAPAPRGAGASTQVEVHVSGTWRMRVYRRGPGGPALVGWAAPERELEVRQDADGLPSPAAPDEDELQAQLGREVLLRIGPGGEVVAILMPRGLHPLVESIWKEWSDVAVLRAPPDSAPVTWTAEGDDAVGAYRDRYREPGGGVVVRTRETYRLADALPGAAAGRDAGGAGLDGAEPAPRPLRVESENRYEVDPNRGYLASGEGTLVAEGEFSEAEGAPEVLVARTFRFAHDSFERRDPADLRRELADRHGVDGTDALGEVLATTTPAEPAGRRDAGGIADGRREAAGARSVPEELARLESSLDATDAAGAPERAAARLRRALVAEPEAASAVEARLDRVELSASPRLRGLLLDALAGAGTPEAQAALARRIERSRTPAAARRTLLAAGRVERPSDELYERVRELSEDEDVPPAVRREALRAFGALTSGRDVRSFGPEGPVDLLDRLGGLASSADATATRRAALHALGSSGLPTAVGPIRDATSDDGAGPAVVEAAVAALEQLPSTASVDALASLASSRPDAPAVEHRVVSALADKAGSPDPAVAHAARDHLHDVLRESGRVEVRLQALDYWIGRLVRGDGGRARYVVERAARDDPAAPVRERAREALESVGVATPAAGGSG
jgi:hypothetical protein